LHTSLSKSPSVFLPTRLASPYALLLAAGLALLDAAGALYGSDSSTWRNVSRAVVLTRFSVC